MKPFLKFLDEELIKKIIKEAKLLLVEIGIEINNDFILEMLGDNKIKIDKKKKRAYIPSEIVEKTLNLCPKSIKLYDVLGNETHVLEGNNVYFTPGSTAIHILEYPNNIRKPNTYDYINYTKVISQLEYIQSQSTAFIPADVPEEISDSYRLYLSLLFCEKPVVTGTFKAESFNIMKDMQIIIRGSEEKLKEKPLTIFSCCPTSPLKWSYETSQNLIDCAKYKIPVEYISMPLSGFMAPVTLVGTLIQHTAETFSGIVISQLTNPGTPVIYGGSPAIFDIRYETTPMGAIETQMIDCAYNEIGKYLGLPTQAYIGLSDAKLLDAQAGLETGIGLILATLSGINSISGPGMLDFESCQSLEKLVLDNEICGMALRLKKGIEPKEDFPSLNLFKELIEEQHLLISSHTRKYLKEVHYFPSNVIDRANFSRWKEEGKKTLGEKANERVKELIKNYKPSKLSQDKKRELEKIMNKEAEKYNHSLVKLEY